MSTTNKVKEWVQWKSNIKPTTCKACKEKHGKFFTIEELEKRGDMPPLHPNCRCRLVKAKPPAKRKSEKEPVSVPGGVYGRPPMNNDSEPPPRRKPRSVIVDELIEELNRLRAAWRLRQTTPEITEPDMPISEEIVFPVENGRMGCPFGCECTPLHGARHNGIDILRDRSRNWDDPILAVMSGTVEYGSDTIQDINGLYIRIRSDDGRTVTSYVHLAQITVPNGARVEVGDQIGFMGATGMGGGTEVGVFHDSYHLHFGVQYDGVWQDPLEFFDW